MSKLYKKKLKIVYIVIVFRWFTLTGHERGYGVDYVASVQRYERDEAPYRGSHKAGDQEEKKGLRVSNV